MRLILALLALALAGLLALQWRDWPPQRLPSSEAAGGAPPSEGPPPGEESPLDRLSPLEDRQEYAVVKERPLFLPDRRPPPEQPPAEEPVPVDDAKLDQMDLSAVVITPEETLAWVRDPAKPGLVRLRLGDDLEGWSVQEVLSDRLVLERRGETNTLVLRDYSNMPPAVPPRPSPAPRTPPQPPQPPQQGGPQPVQQAQPQQQAKPHAKPQQQATPAPAGARGQRPPAAGQPPNAPANPAARNQRMRGHAQANRENQ